MTIFNLAICILSGSLLILLTLGLILVFSSFIDSDKSAPPNYDNDYMYKGGSRNKRWE